jgi:hypothetical protein
MRKSIIVAIAGLAFLASACGAQAGSPQVDAEAGASQDEVGGQVTSASQETGTPQEDTTDSAGTDETGTIVREDDQDDEQNYDQDADDNMRSGAQLPDDFPVPVPNNYAVEAVGEAGNETSVVLRVPSGEDAYNYYRQALADEGFRVVDEGRDPGIYFEADLEFSSDALEGNMEFDRDAVQIEIERYS